MAAILATRTAGRVLILNVSGDPNSGGGTDAPVGSLAMDGVTGVYQKKTTSLTGWVELVFNGGYPVIPDAGGGSFTLDAQLYKQGSLDLTLGGQNFLMIDHIKAGDTYIVSLTNTTGADTLVIIDSNFFFTTIIPSTESAGGGEYVPTAVAGAKDRLLITFDGTFIWASSIGRDFIP